MCGIAGIISKNFKNIIPKLVKMIKNLEYRGYDSCGFAFLDRKNSIVVKKAAGTIDNFVEKHEILSMESYIGIAHTRWATHGAVNDINAHPHIDCYGKIAVVHNGIIDNFLELRRSLESEGHNLVSETDTEVIPHLIEHFYSEKKTSFLDALKDAVNKLQGTYALVILTSYEPEKIFFARNGQPLMVGLGNDEIYLSLIHI